MAAAEQSAQFAQVNSDELVLASRALGGGAYRTELSVPDVHCGACIRRVEKALGNLAGVDSARVNLSTRRVVVQWRAPTQPPPIKPTLDRLGYPSHYCDDVPDAQDPQMKRLVRSLAVAGFAASNIMLLSVSVWWGAEDQSRHLFHWLSALIAFPTLLYSGRVFFNSAFNALVHGHTNMDVPISIGVALAFALSLYETVVGGQHAYFDASVTLLFFLLIGRTLDHMMRTRARTAITGLARMAARGANVVGADGKTRYVPVNEVQVGSEIELSAGDRVPVDGTVVRGEAEIDTSMVSGEAAPQLASVGALLRAGTMNLSGALRMRTTATVGDSFLAEMVRLMEAAEGGRARYRRIADRAAQLYSPVVHLTALLTFIGWMIASGDWHFSVTTAISVLIITCPCALGLAVPIVQVVAASRLFEMGVLTKDGSGIERLATIDTIVLDKTGTVTVGVPRLKNLHAIEDESWRIAASLAKHSKHPISRALAAQRPDADLQFDVVREYAGLGLEGTLNGTVYRLGRADWASRDRQGTETVLSLEGQELASFEFEDQLRLDAENSVTALRDQGFKTMLLSGDSQSAVARMAAAIGVDTFQSEMLPDEKLRRVNELRASGHAVLMVGDGLNDAPALAGATVSMAPSSAADIGRNAADFVFTRESLAAVPMTVRVAQKSSSLIRQNLAFAVLYNAVAVPVAIAGYATPLVAAIAMSLSSIIVVANALRLRQPVKANERQTVPAKPMLPAKAAKQ